MLGLNCDLFLNGVNSFNIFVKLDQTSELQDILKNVFCLLFCKLWIFFVFLGVVQTFMVNLGKQIYVTRSVSCPRLLSRRENLKLKLTYY